MWKTIAASTLMTLAVSPSSLRGSQTAPLVACLHGSSEQPNDRTRREQALRMAAEINRAEGLGFGSPANRRYRRLDQLTSVPPTPPGFRMQFLTDGATYAFSLKDVRDPCNY